MSIAKRLHAMARLGADKPAGLDLRRYDGRRDARPVAPPPETPPTPEARPRRQGEQAGQLTMFD